MRVIRRLSITLNISFVRENVFTQPIVGSFVYVVDGSRLKYSRQKFRLYTLSCFSVLVLMSKI